MNNSLKYLVYATKTMLLVSLPYLSAAEDVFRRGTLTCPGLDVGIQLFTFPFGGCNPGTTRPRTGAPSRPLRPLPFVTLH
jgi:hypothetical protein